jgi:hypothetical protein
MCFIRFFITLINCIDLITFVFAICRSPSFSRVKYIFSNSLTKDINSELSDQNRETKPILFFTIQIKKREKEKFKTQKIVIIQFKKRDFPPALSQIQCKFHYSGFLIIDSFSRHFLRITVIHFLLLMFVVLFR